MDSHGESRRGGSAERQLIKGSVQVVKAEIDSTVMANTTMVPTMEKEVLVCDITQISTTHTGIITAVAIRNRLNRFWELTPLILFLKELLVGSQAGVYRSTKTNSIFPTREA